MDQSQNHSHSLSQEHPRTDQALAAERVASYHQLKAIGAATHRQSSAGLLTTGAEPVSEDQIKVQKLGVLLHEVDIWNTAATEAEDWRARFAAAKSKKAELLACLPVSSFNAVHECLDWTPRDFDDADGLAKWLGLKVVAPLKDALDRLPRNLGWDRRCCFVLTWDGRSIASVGVAGT